jgi:hypothetical protein
MDGKAWLAALLGNDMVLARVTLRLSDVVFVKGIFEASEGLGAIFAEPRGSGHSSDDRTQGGRDGGALVIAAPRSREAELRSLVRDLELEIPEMRGALWETT